MAWLMIAHGQSEWGRLFFMLAIDRLMLRNMAIAKAWKKARQVEQPFTWRFAQVAPVIIGDRRDPAQSRPEIGRRQTDWG